MHVPNDHTVKASPPCPDFDRYWSCYSSVTTNNRRQRRNREPEPGTSGCNNNSRDTLSLSPVSACPSTRRTRRTSSAPTGIRDRKSPK
ncbi:hypothetical protein RRG08_036349 [Elysia crispata]|uniref:Uncharacterized protein n=1 Tax=Elysia crispata TaxID=231223 RepID=A0AAE1DHJ0_9GAST|nr:hypothetical protein RRG08_036349 [Elysia crispata]